MFYQLILPRMGRGNRFSNASFTGTVTGGSYTLANGLTMTLGSGGAVNTPADTTEDTLATITVPAGAMGANGALRIVCFWTFTNSGNSKTMRVRFSGAAGTIMSTIVLTSQVTTRVTTDIINTSASAQVGMMEELHPSSGPTHIFGTAGAINTAVATTIVITGQKATAGETLTLNGYTVELIKP